MSLYRCLRDYGNYQYFEGTKKGIVAYLRTMNANFRVSEVKLIKPKKITSQTVVTEQKKLIRRRQKELKRAILKHEAEVSELNEKMATLEGGVAIKSMKKPYKQ